MPYSLYLEPVVGADELLDPELPDVVLPLDHLRPLQRSPHSQKTHADCSAPQEKKDNGVRYSIVLYCTVYNGGKFRVGTWHLSQ